MKSGINDCYEAAGRLISTLPSNAFLVHGTIYSTKLHRQIRHAWVEHNGYVFDFSNGKRHIIKLEDYYREGHAIQIVLYSREQAIKMLKHTRMFEWWTLEQRKKILGEETL